jgi:ABC-type transport system involved in cytochrome bd biosynthesis fused ATPase/permease subunit
MTLRFVELFHLLRRAFAAIGILILIILSLFCLIPDLGQNKELEIFPGILVLTCAIAVALTLREESSLYKQSIQAGEQFKELIERLRTGGGGTQ